MEENVQGEGTASAKAVSVRGAEATNRRASDSGLLDLATMPFP